MLKTLCVVLLELTISQQPGQSLEVRYTQLAALYSPGTWMRT